MASDRDARRHRRGQCPERRTEADAQRAHPLSWRARANVSGRDGGEPGADLGDPASRFPGVERFQPRDSRGKRVLTGGYFSREADANVIVMPVARDDDALQTIFHEYTHYFVSRNVRTSVAGWLSEGIAEFYSTFRGDYRGKT